MHVLENVSLATHSTMRLGGKAAFMTEVSTRQGVVEAVTWAQERNLPSILIGDGSNIIWSDAGYPGLVMVNKIPGVEIASELGDIVYVTAGSGVNWDSFVGQMVSKDLTGLEFLSLVPGTVGATPVQNVGAYGAEVSQLITTLEAYDAKLEQFVTLRGDECQFGYRTSRFKTVDRGRFFITSVTFQLQKGNPKPPYYAALQRYFDEHSITDITPQAVRAAVIAIRSAKLPDPAVGPNNGSFFANPIISNEDFVQLAADYPSIPHWQTEKGVKLAAAWLIDQAGFKDFHDAETGMATWHAQSLVLVNEHARSSAQLIAFRDRIVNAVQARFNINLEQEPELI